MSALSSKTKKLGFVKSYLKGALLLIILSAVFKYSSQVFFVYLLLVFNSDIHNI